jgi:diguanylate cyclase (GGDEF)-like protein
VTSLENSMNSVSSPTLFGLPRKLAAYIGAVAAVGIPTIGIALGEIVAHPPGWGNAARLVPFFALALLADLQPVPMDGAGKSEVSTANVFIVATAILFGWRYAVLLAAFSVGVTFVVTRRPLTRTIFNVSMYVVSAFAAALPVTLLGSVHGLDAGRITIYVLTGATLQLLVNVVLVSEAISIAASMPYRSVLFAGLRQSGAAFAIMGFLAALTANLWVMRPWLLSLLAGPLFTLVLYQRSALHSRIALRDARTDNLTSLGNHRAYQAALRELTAAAEATGTPFSLALLDVDDFKRVNDSYGHPAGDELLVQLAGLLETIESAQAFRFGGDEFAILCELDEASAFRAVEEVQERIAGLQTPGGAVTISVGIATYPAHASSAEELQRTADGALYWSKRHGKNRSCVYSPSVVRVFSAEELERATERDARLRAAKNLVRFVDARDPSTASHSQIVSSLAEAIGIELGLDPETIERLRLAGLLHDLGKIGLPDAILHAPRALTDEEFAIVRRHPEFGHALLDGLGVEPVDTWVLHHHEHWDGDGYPNGLAGEEIPLGARIILVADAFEAITADRPYRKAQSPQAALAELSRNAGTQFDPDVVAALARHLSGVSSTAVALV